MTGPTAAPARFPYYEHRTLAEIAAGVPETYWLGPKEEARAAPPADRRTSAEQIAARQVDRSTCFRCGARTEIGCEHVGVPGFDRAFA